jgi:hypothetical protein
MSAQRDSYRVDESKPWFSSEAGWPDKVPKNVDFPRITLYEMLSRSAKARPDLPAIWFLNTFMSYGELLRHVDAFAAGIQQLGLRKGDVVALALPSCFQYVISYYACAKLGLIAAGVNPTYKPREVLHELKLTGAKALIVLDALYSLLITPIAAQHPLAPVVVTSIVDMVNVSSFKKWLGKKLKKIPTGPVPDQAEDPVDLHEDRSLSRGCCDLRHDRRHNGRSKSRRSFPFQLRRKRTPGEPLDVDQGAGSLYGRHIASFSRLWDECCHECRHLQRHVDDALSKAT